MDQHTTQVIAELKREIASLRDTLGHHKHDGVDGSSKLAYGIDIKTGQIFSVANVGGFTAYQDSVNKLTTTTIGSALNTNQADGTGGAFVYLTDIYGSDGTSNLSFFAGSRSIIAFGSSGIIQTGSSTLTQNEYDLVPNSLVGEYLQVVNPAGGIEQYKVLSNDRTAITVDGTWSFSGGSLIWEAANLIYLGSAGFPWRTIYTADTTAGGIRFGFGLTGGGQNGRLFADPADGSLKWQDYAGVTHNLY